MPPKLFARGDHPILTRLYRDDKTRESNTYLKFLLIDRYFPVNRARWNPAPGTTDELLTLPNYRSMDDYKDEAQRLLNQMPTDDEKAGPYAKLLKEHQRHIKDVLANGKQLYQLANAVEAMLNDTADPKDPAKPDLRTFWQQPAQAELLGGVPAAGRIGPLRRPAAGRPQIRQRGRAGLPDHGRQCLERFPQRPRPAVLGHAHARGAKVPRRGRHAT